MKYFVFIAIFLSFFNKVSSQTEQLTNDSIVVFYFPSGKPSSEGIMRNGKPDGYWKSYFKSGRLKTEGNRINHLLEGAWNFYDDNGKLRTIIHYQAGLKNGNRIAFDENEKLISTENFRNDLLQDTSKIYFKNGVLQAITLFQDGKEQGRGIAYDSLGTIKEINDFKEGTLVRKQIVNRLDIQQKRTGLWVELYNNFKTREEITYEKGMKNGYRKMYDTNGNLTKVEKYIDDVLQNEPAELKAAEIKKQYYPDATVKQSGAFLKGIPVGMHIFYSPGGMPSTAQEFENGVLMAKGALDSLGRKTKSWEYYFADGNVKALGNYDQGLKEGSWQYFHSNKQLEQTGFFINGKANGAWKWYYDNGAIRRTDTYRNGKEDGFSVELGIEGDTLAFGEYENGEREGVWQFKSGKIKAKGAFSEGLMEGEWIHKQEGEIIVYRGFFKAGIPIDKHRAFYEDGSLKWEGRLVAGKREGDWRLFGEEGLLYLTISYEEGIEKKYDGVKIRPEFDRSMFENLLESNPFIF